MKRYAKIFVLTGGVLLALLYCAALGTNFQIPIYVVQIWVMVSFLFLIAGGFLMIFNQEKSVPKNLGPSHPIPLQRNSYRRGPRNMPSPNHYPEADAAYERAAVYRRNQGACMPSPDSKD